MQIHFLKISWGDIIILKDDNEIAMVDTGYERDFERINDYLSALGVKKISFILLTHFHQDHYGSIKKIVENYDVQRVYFKEYSGLDKSTSGGRVADDDYRNREMTKWLEIKDSIIKNSTYVRVEDVKSIDFGNTKLKLFHNENRIKKGI